MTEDRSDRGGSSTSRPKPSPRSSRSATASSTSRSPGSPRALLARHGVEPSKALGQHFLIDPNLAAAIAADAGVGPGDAVLDIGAGLGALTTALAERGAERVLAVEFDRALIPALRAVAGSHPAVEVLAADATKTDWSSVLGDRAWIACGNLPYNVGRDRALGAGARADDPAARGHGSAGGRRPVGRRADGDAREVRPDEPACRVPRRRDGRAAGAGIGVLATPIGGVGDRSHGATRPAARRGPPRGALACRR